MVNHSRALVLLGLGTLLFALGPAVLKLLTSMGGPLGIVHPGALSFCNVLFVGNFAAGLVTLAIYRPGPLVREIRDLSRATKGYLWLAAIVSVIYPALIYTALEQTSVINIVLLSRFNGIVYVALAYLLFRATLEKSAVLGYSMIALGVATLVVVNNMGFSLLKGEILVLVAALFFALTEFLSKRVLRDCSIESYVFFRNAVSALIFFVIASYLYGFDHFSEAFAPGLWLLMLVYAGFAVVGAQLAWLSATRVLPAETVANSQLLSPAFSIFFAFLLLTEIPTTLEWLVMALILVGTILPRLHREHARHHVKSLTFGTHSIGM